MNVRLYFGAKMVTFCIIHIGNRKIFLCSHILHNICEKLAGTRGGGGGGGGGGMISYSSKSDDWASPNISIRIFGVLS